MWEIPAILLMALGLFFMIIGAVGLLRFPDFYTRAHAVGKCDSLGEGLLVLGFVVYEGFSFTTIKLLLLVLFIFVLPPTATYAIVHAAYQRGLKPWVRGEARR
jgi:multicomponent Na+:H+ antiporter subunit G